ncbi:MAG: hypothetical protein ACOCXG_04425 [Nanoarchaeota archaeon]
MNEIKLMVILLAFSIIMMGVLLSMFAKRRVNSKSTANILGLVIGFMVCIPLGIVIGIGSGSYILGLIVGIVSGIGIGLVFARNLNRKRN